MTEKIEERPCKGPLHSGRLVPIAGINCNKKTGRYDLVCKECRAWIRRAARAKIRREPHITLEYPWAIALVRSLKKSLSAKGEADEFNYSLDANKVSWLYLAQKERCALSGQLLTVPTPEMPIKKRVSIDTWRHELSITKQLYTPVLVRVTRTNLSWRAGNVILICRYLKPVYDVCINLKGFLDLIAGLADRGTPTVIQEADLTRAQEAYERVMETKKKKRKKK